MPTLAGMSFGVVLLAVVVLAGLSVAFLYNRLIRLRHLVEEAWSGIDVQLKRRHDLVPQLVDVVKGYVRHERSLLEDLTRIRGETMKARGPAEAEAAEERLTLSLRPILALAEAYPDLKANTNFLDLQQRLAETEDQLQMARRYFNGTVRNYNILVESFPANILAGLFGFGVKDYFELESATERDVPKVDFGETAGV